jgi:mannose-1-phosphate guanylyltransferase/mannose-1-phosphate guanylyltransferase/phosphomannomutase
VVSNLHYFPEQIEKRFGDGSEWGLRLSYSYEEELLGTAGGVRNVRDHFGDETFLIISGDALTDIDLTALWEAHKARGGIATLSLKRVDDPSQIGVVILAEDGRIQGFQEKPDPAEALSNLGNCGIYVMEPEIFDFFPDRPFVDWALDVFPALLAQDVPFYGHEITEYWNDIGNIREFRQGNFDAIAGEVSVEFDPGRLNPDGIEIEEPPVYVGAACEIAAGARLTGPLVMGDRCSVGEGAAIRDSVLWPGTVVAPHEVLIGAVAATGPLAGKV